MEQKEKTRRARMAFSATGPTETAWGKAAERLRRHPFYREAQLIFAGPGRVLSQFRINCQLDGKELLVPAPGLKEGFLYFKSRSIPPPELGFALSPRGLSRFGRPLSVEQLTGLGLELLLTEAVAVDRDGRRLGDGRGWFDLAYGILGSLEALAEQPAVIAILEENEILPDALPEEIWDIPVTAAVTPAGMHYFSGLRPPRGRIFWEQLSPRHIKKCAPLYELHRRRKG